MLLAAMLMLLADGPAAAREPTPAGVTPYGNTLLAQINLLRRDSGLGELTFEPALVKVARTHSFHMFQQKQLSHLGFKKRFAQSGSHLCVENVGWNFPNPLKQFDAWHGSVGHDRNMLVEDLRKAGIAEVGGYVTFIACR
jgi:uncharacterized protein YkwD